MITKEAIELLSQAEAIMAAADALNQPHCPKYVALPRDLVVHDVESGRHTRTRARGRMKTGAVGDFARYVMLHGESATVFVDHRRMRATAVLDMGTPDDPGHCDNTAVLKAERTESFAHMTRLAGTLRNTREIADFFSDWQDYMSFTDAAGVSIDPGAAIAAMDDEPTPMHASFTCAPYKGLLPRTFDLRVHAAGSTEGRSVVLTVAQKGEHLEDMRREFVGMVADHFTPSENCFAYTPPVLIGTYTKRT